MTIKKQATVIVAGGGTGGHIYPGIAIARAVQKKYPHCQVEFVGTAQGLEDKIVPREGFRLHKLSIGKLHSSVAKSERLWSLIKLPWVVLETLWLFFRLKPQAVIGVGGYASGPFVLIASLFGARTAIWEPNAVPGVANRWLSPFVQFCFIVFDGARERLKCSSIVKCGLPVRQEIQTLTPSVPHPNFRILIFGGSQGARAINKIVAEAVQRSGTWAENIEITHQTGPHDFAFVQAAYAQSEVKHQVFDYIHNMTDWYAWADLVICRAGASTVAEIAACQKPAVFVPLPTAADNHQELNAIQLVQAHAAMMILQKDFTPEKFCSVVEELKNNPSARKQMSEQVKAFYSPGAAERIVDVFLEGVI